MPRTKGIESIPIQLILAGLLGLFAFLAVSAGEDSGRTSGNNRGDEHAPYRMGSVFRSDLYGVQINVPLRWEQRTFPADSVVTFLQSQEHRTEPVLRMDMVVKSPVSRLQRAIKSLRKGYKGKGTRYRGTDDKTIRISGYEGRIYGGTYVSGGERMKQIDLVVIRNRVLYLASIKGKRSVLRNRERELRNILRSLTLFEPSRVDSDTKERFLSYFRRGERSLRNQNIRNAISWYKKAARVFPGSTEVHRRLQELYHRIHRYRDSIREGNVALNAIPGSAAQHFFLGLSKYRLNRLESAKQSLQKAVKREDFPEARMNLARVLFELGRTERAISMVRKLVQDRKRVPMGRLLLGRFYRSKKEYRKAENAFREILQERPRNQKAQEALESLRRIRDAK